MKKPDQTLFGAPIYTNVDIADPNVEPPNYKPPSSLKELLERHAAGETYFVGATIPDADLSGSEISGCNMRDANLRNLKLDRACARYTDFSGANLSGARLVGAELEGANFRGALLTDVVFSPWQEQALAAKCEKAPWAGERMTADALLERFEWGERNFRWVDLSDLDLSNAYLDGIILERANLRGVTLQGASLRKANLSKSELRHAALDSSDLSGATLVGAKLGSGQEAECLWDDPETAVGFYVCSRDSASMKGANLTDADLSGADLLGVNLTKAILVRSNLTDADLTETDLTDARLEGTDIRGADFRTAFFDDAVFIDVDPSVAVWNDGLQPLFLQEQNDGLTLYFSTRITFFDRFIVEGVILAVLGQDTTCRVVEFKELANDNALVRLGGAPRADLEAVAEALWNRIWDIEEKSQLRALAVATAGLRLDLRAGLESLVSRLERMELRMSSEDVVEMQEDQAAKYMMEKNIGILETRVHKVARLLRTWGMKKVLGEIEGEVTDLVKDGFGLDKGEKKEPP